MRLHTGEVTALFSWHIYKHLQDVMILKASRCGVHDSKIKHCIKKKT